MTNEEWYSYLQLNQPEKLWKAEMKAIQSRYRMNECNGAEDEEISDDD